MLRDVPGDRPTPAGRASGTARARRRHVLPRHVAALAALAVLTACGSPTTASPAVTSAAPTPAATSTAPTPAAAPVPDVPLQDAALGAQPAVAAAPAPTRVTVPDLGIDMPVDPVGVEDDGTMEIPQDADRAGWYRFGPAPADPEGATVVAAHVDSWTTGVGPFSLLRDVAVGARVELTTADGTVHAYTVQEVVQVPKGDAPVERWFDRSGAPRIVLVTCGGAFDREVGHYSDNVAVTAVPVG